MMFSQKSLEGEVMVDHRASPGIPEAQARQMGYEPSLVGEGRLMMAALLTCAHCNQAVIKNPLRTRERACCLQCGGNYICDLCNVERLKPDYAHMPFRKIVDLVGSGQATVLTLGVSPVLIPTKAKEY